MPNIRKPRSGSMAVSPRKRAKRHYARVRSWADDKEAKLLGFIGYKVGMTHLIVNDNKPNALTKGSSIHMPVTIVECPSIKTSSLRFYKKTPNGLKIVSEIMNEKLDKELARKIRIPKSVKKKVEDIKEFDEIRVNCYTQPKLTTIGKKKPELFEVKLGGNKDEQLAKAKELLGKEIGIKDVFGEGEFIDIHTITKGRGNQGPVKRFGIGFRDHKSEKGVRKPGSLGGWTSQQHVMPRIAYAGQHGYHQRTEYNKTIIKIVEDPKELETKSGYKHYGIIKNSCVIIKGSIAGPQKRAITMVKAARPNKRWQPGSPDIEHIHQL